MLGEEGCIHADEYDQEMRLGYFFVEGESRQRRIPECNPGKDRKNSTYWQYIVEMRYYVVGVMQSDVEGTIGQNDSRQTPDGK